MADLTRPTNRDLLASLLTFKDGILAAKRKPLPFPSQWYPYTSTDTIYTIIDSLDRNGLDASDIIHDQHVVDIGAANAELTIWAEQMGAASATAVDWDAIDGSWMVAARTLRKTFGSHIGIVNADVNEWRPPRHYDTVICCGLLYHAPAPMTVLQRLVTMGDTLILGTKVWRDPRPLMHVWTTAECNGDPTNWFCPTEEALMRMLDRAGYDVECSEIYGGTGEPTAMSEDARIVVLAKARPVVTCEYCGLLFRERDQRHCFNCRHIVGEIAAPGAEFARSQRG